ncbi:MAG: cell envelope biogenesis protein OmpA [Bacteroidota bacterium]
MNNSKIHKVVFGCLIMLFCSIVTAQHSKVSKTTNLRGVEADKRIDDYLRLLKLGYTEKEIFEDLGNVNFLTENYGTAAFWYQKLMDIEGDDAISASYHERYQYAMGKAGITTPKNASDKKDWLASIKQDYSSNTDMKALDRLVQYEIPLEHNGNRSKKEGAHAYRPPVSVTSNGNTAYFSKAVYIKPKYGLFSKKQLVHRIYRAEKIKGQWKNVKEVAVCPKYSSAIHPTVSDDGKRLFFASDMPGTFGAYDIYVSVLQDDGTFGIAKNLGQKVNTDKNDLYPNIIGGTSLVFASDGHKGQGGLDIFMAQVAHKKVGRSFNLGSNINSPKDDFSIVFGMKKGMGYVISDSDRHKGELQQVAFSYADIGRNSITAGEEYQLAEILNNDQKTDYSSTIFVDE